MICATSSFSDITFKGGGNLVIEDAQGFTSCTYLEDGFFEFLDKVCFDRCSDGTYFLLFLYLHKSAHFITSQKYREFSISTVIWCFFAVLCF